MSLTIELPPEIELALRAAASREGVPPEELVARAVAERFAIGRNGETSDEGPLVEAIREELPTAFWDRYCPLRDRAISGVLTEAERTELSPLIDQMEMFNARRITLLAELARLRRTDISTLMAQLQVGPVQIPA